MSIPDGALNKYRRLQQMHTVAAATAAGLREPVEHWRDELGREATSFEHAARAFGDRVIVENGKAVRLSTVSKSTGRSSGLIKTWDERREEIPDLAGFAAQYAKVQDRLTDARDQHEAAAEKSATLQTALSEARTALKARGWVESR